MARLTIKVTMRCDNCFKKYSLLNWQYFQRIRRGLERAFCSVKCRDKFQQGENAPAYKGGTRKMGIYRQVLVGKNKYVFEHRLVMEKKIGRKLKKNEVVHHINGDTLDNRIKNLVLCVSPGKHTSKYHPRKKVTNGKNRMEKISRNEQARAGDQDSESSAEYA